MVVNRKKGSTFIISQPEAYFVAVVDQYLVVDSGTSPNNRGLDVYDLDENKVVLSTVHEDLKVEERVIRFTSQIEIA
ncbi:hypothetical protein, partial [Rhizobium leguminosarum]|uniref:hypothetical protein n=1 Tax=Rhizobium leguminosarum TaxID=384 RepID=UPI003F9DFEF5